VNGAAAMLQSMRRRLARALGGAAAVPADDAGPAPSADIVGRLEGIAFQTNVLALNAAVEAARGGASASSFAAVAAEARALGQHSTQAARCFSDPASARPAAEAALRQIAAAAQRVARHAASAESLREQAARLTETAERGETTTHVELKP
jgi:hypothetical protein